MTRDERIELGYRHGVCRIVFRAAPVVVSADPLRATLASAPAVRAAARAVAEGREIDHANGGLLQTGFRQTVRVRGR